MNIKETTNTDSYPLTPSDAVVIIGQKASSNELQTGNLVLSEATELTALDQDLYLFVAISSQTARYRQDFAVKIPVGRPHLIM